MAIESPVHMFTFEAAADLTAAQYRFVTVDSSGEAALVALGGSADGVVQNDPDTGEAASVMLSGITRVEASAAISAGDDVASAASGKAKTSTTGNVILGKALDAAGADGEFLSVLLYPGSRATTA